MNFNAASDKHPKQITHVVYRQNQPKILLNKYLWNTAYTFGLSVPKANRFLNQALNGYYTINRLHNHFQTPFLESIHTLLIKFKYFCGFFVVHLSVGTKVIVKNNPSQNSPSCLYVCIYGFLLPGTSFNHPDYFFSSQKIVYALWHNRWNLVIRALNLHQSYYIHPYSFSSYNLSYFSNTT